MDGAGPDIGGGGVGDCDRGVLSGEEEVEEEDEDDEGAIAA